MTDPRFLVPLILKYIDGHNFCIVDGFDYYTDVIIYGDRTNQRVIHIPRGFMTDFASIPRLFWNILPPTGPYGKAAVVHDYLYRTPLQATKAEADEVFLEAMTALRVNWFVRYIMYWAVHIFGGSNYHGGVFSVLGDGNGPIQL